MKIPINVKRPTAPATPATLAALAICTLASLTGCTPSIEKLSDMRSDLAPKAMAKNYDTVSKYFAEPQGGTWRAEAMTTMAELNNHLAGQGVNCQPPILDKDDPQLQQLTQSGFPSATKRQNALISALQKEYADPDIKRKDRTPEYLLKGWAIYSLGKIPDENLVEFYTDVLIDNAGDLKNNLYVASAAMSALSRHIPLLKKNDLLRGKALEGVAAVNSTLRKANRSSSSVQRARPIMNYLENNIKDYDSVVKLLPNSPKSEVSTQVLLEVLLWNYQKLKTSDLQSANGTKSQMFDENVRRLLLLCWHNDPNVRTRSRVILEQFAPLDLFAALEKKIAKRTAIEDYVHTASLLAVADKAAGKNNMEYLAKRQSAFKSLFDSISRIPTSEREVIYARLIETDAQLLGDKLLEISEKVKSESPDKMLQHVRYLVKLRGKPFLGTSSDMVDKINVAIAGFIAPRSYALRKQVIAAIMDDRPLLLATAIAAELQRFASQPGEDCDYLCDSYLGCLEKLEESHRTSEAISTFAAAFKSHPHKLLAGASARPEIPIRKKVASFLENRDIELLVSLLAKNTNPGNYEHLVMLGDIYQSHQKQISPVLSQQVMSIFSRAMDASDEEIALLCGRYYLECGGRIAPARLSSFSQAVRSLVKLKTKADAKLAGGNSEKTSITKEAIQ